MPQLLVNLMVDLMPTLCSILSSWKGDVPCSHQCCLLHRQAELLHSVFYPRELAELHTYVPSALYCNLPIYTAAPSNQKHPLLKHNTIAFFSIISTFTTIEAVCSCAFRTSLPFIFSCSYLLLPRLHPVSLTFEKVLLLIKQDGTTTSNS
jgi:hypothetical protein